MVRWLIVLSVVLMFASVAQAVTVEPGVDVTVTFSPNSGTGPTTVARTVTITNSNVNTTTSSTSTYNYRASPTATPVPVLGVFTFTMLGQRNNRLVDVPVGTDETFLTGTLSINGVTQTDPTPANGKYTLTLNLPTATNLTTPSVTTIVDRVTKNPPTS